MCFYTFLKVNEIIEFVFALFFCLVVAVYYIHFGLHKLGLNVLPLVAILSFLFHSESL